MRLAKKYFHLKNNAVYNSSAKNKRKNQMNQDHQIFILCARMDLNRGFHKYTTLVIMPILASEALLRENKKNPVTKCYPKWE